MICSTPLPLYFEDVKYSLGILSRCVCVCGFALNLKLICTLLSKGEQLSSRVVNQAHFESCTELTKQMGVAAVVHLYVFPAVPYKRGERCVRNVAVLADYASLGNPPDPDEVQDCERTTKIRLSRPDEKEKRPKFHQSVRDVVFGSSEIVRCKFLASIYFFFKGFYLESDSQVYIN